MNSILLSALVLGLGLSSQQVTDLKSYVSKKASSVIDAFSSNESPIVLNLDPNIEGNENLKKVYSTLELLIKAESKKNDRRLNIAVASVVGSTIVLGGVFYATRRK